jgi:hypothetical protein
METPHDKPIPKISPVTRGDIFTLAGELNSVPANSIVDVVTITTHACMGCGLPHVICLSATNEKSDTIVAILAMAITDLLETYGFPDDEGASPGQAYEWGKLNGSESPDTT